jgi:hypothetical protein
MMNDPETTMRLLAAPPFDAASGSAAFTPTHTSDFDDPVEIVCPTRRLAGMICVRRADGYEWFTTVLKPLPPNS